MAVSARFRPPALTSSYQDWDRLWQAHTLMRRGQIASGIPHYKALVGEGFDRYFTEGLWPLHDQPGRPSLVWACLYLAEYCSKLRLWSGWRYLSKRYIFSDPTLQLTDCERSRLTSTLGLAQVYARGANLQKIEAEQQTALSTLRLTDFERGLHHILLGEIHRQFRRTDAAFVEFERALRLLPLETEPFYHIRVLEAMAAAYDYLKDLHPPYADRAIAVYEQINQAVDQLGEDAAPERAWYGLGWVYAETGRLDEALHAFRHGYEDAVRYGLSYHERLNEYGQAYVHICRGEPDAAVTLLQRARRGFWANASELTMAAGEVVSPLMTAVSSDLLAIAYDVMGKTDDALSEAQKALAFQRQLHSPVQLHNTLSSLITLHRKKRHWLLAARYWLEDTLLRRRIHK